MRARSWLRRALVLAAKLVLAAVILLLVALDVAFIALELPSGQRFVLDRINAFLADQFRGTLRIDAVDDIDFAGVRGARVSLIDPDGRPIAEVNGVEGNVDLALLLHSLLDGSGPLRIHLQRPAIRDSVVVLRPDPHGDLTIATSFEPKHPKPEPSEPGREIDFRLESLSIAHAWVHGAIDEVPIDSDLSNAEASLHYDADGFGLDELESHVVARGLPRSEKAEGQLRGMLVAPLRGDFGGFLRFDGSVDEVPARVEARISGEAIAVAVDVPHAEPAALRRLLPELSIQVPGRLRAFGDGTAKRLDLVVDAEAGRARAHATGELRFDPRFQVEARVGVKDLELRELDPELPAIRADADATVSFAPGSHGRRSKGKLRLNTRRLELEGKRYPASVLNAALDGETLTGTLNVPAGGPENRLRFRIDGLLRSGAIEGEAEAQLKLEDLRGVASLPSDLGGSGLAKASFRVDRKTNIVNAVVAADLSGVWLADLGVGRARIEGSAVGSLRDPRIAARAELTDVVRPEVKLQRLSVDASGSLDRIRVAVTGNEAKGRRVVGRADVDLKRLAAKDLQVVVANGGVELRANAKSLTLRDRGVAIEDLKIEGAGDLELSIETRPGSMTVAGKGRDIDLERIARLLRIEQRVSRGKGTFDVDLRIAGSQITGRANVRLQDAMFDDIGPFDASLDAVSEAGKLDGTLSADLSPAGDLRLRAVELRLGPEGPTLDGLKGASGRLELQARAHLGRLPARVSDRLPFDRTRGRVRLAVDVQRLTPRAAADLRVYVDTRGLEVLGSSSKARILDRTEAIRKKPWRLSGMDLVAELRVLGATGRSNLLARIHDARGALVDAQAEAPITIEDALDGALATRVREEPLELRVVVPRRELAQLPAMLRPAGLSGVLALDAQASGTFSEPNLAFDFRVDRMRSKDPNRRFSMDFHAQGRHLRQRTEVALDAANRGKPLAHARVWADGALPDLMRGKGFVASGRAKFDGLPLALVPMLRERQVRGKLFGDVAVTDLGKDAKALARLETKDLRFGALDVSGAALEMRAENGRLFARASVDHPGGFARAKLDGGIDWGDRMAFEVDDAHPLEAELLAKDFRAAVLLPFVNETFSDLDGKLDANLRVSAKGGRTEVLGEANLEEGILQIPALGQQLRDVEGGMRAEPGGILKIEHASARALTGKVRGAASARLKGLSLYAVDARIRIDRREQIPVTTEGVTLGEAWGDADVSLRTLPQKNTTQVTVKVPRFHLEMTEVERSNLQPLDDPEHVRVGVQLEHRKFRSLPLQPLEESGDGGSRLLLDLDFGDDVWVRQGTTLRAKIQGRLALDIREKATARGVISLSRGVIDVQGKRFEVERGIVTFRNDDPSNPLVVATARWDSPEGYRVFADYSGRVKNGKLTLRAEPPLSQDEILSLLLFGTPDGSFGAGTEGGGEAALAVGVAGGAATKGLNRALGDLTTLDVSTRIDTSYGDPRPEIVVQLTRRLSAELSYAVGEPAPGQSPDRTFLTLDLRLGSRWSLATTFGDRGASMLDLLWRYRY